jgi:gas vesicle protein
LTLLLAPLSGVATRSLIGRKVKNGEDWVKEKAAEAENYVRTHGAGLRDGVKKAAEVITQS